MDISAKTKEHPELVTVQYELPETLPELVSKFGEEVVANAASAQLVINLQAFMRRHIDKPQAELQELVTQWQPGTRSPSVKKSAFERASGAIANLSPEERQALLARLQAG